MQPLRLGAAYHGNRMPHHARQDLLEKYEVRRCFYGHLHSGSHKLAVEGLWDGVDFKLVASDYLNFKPYTVIL